MRAHTASRAMAGMKRTRSSPAIAAWSVTPSGALMAPRRGQDGAPRGYAQSYEKKSATSQASGTLTAPFSGIHGWFWENTTDQPITVTLTASGFYNLSHEFRTGAPVKNKQFP